ncbi:MAG TPA: M48 family metallopeptidase [Mucilaginibacter sp.]|jgi:predicted Zn-dependent protease|nr:M48 family metallopeptidase [Mucilaginibacter sp.]
MKTKLFFILMVALFTIQKAFSQGNDAKILAAYKKGIRRFMTFETCGSPVDGPAYVYKETENHFLDRILPMTPQREADMGQQGFQQSMESRVANKPRDLQKIREIVGKLVAQSRFPDRQYHVYLIQSNEINAFSTIGGYIYVTTALFDFMESDDELAFVLGHELTHIINNHVVRKEKKIALIANTSQKLNMERFEKIAININLSMSAPFDQMDEYEADRGSIGLVKKAGYDETAFNAFFLDFEKFEKKELFARFTSDHPLSEHRRACLNKIIGKKQ